MQTSRQPNNLATRLEGGVLAVAGLGAIIGACAGAVSTRNFLQTAACAPGVVTRLNAGGFHPEIRFTAGLGQIVNSPQGGMIKRYRVGEWVSLLH